MTQQKKYKEKLWYKALMNLLKFLFHFVLVAILLMGGSAVFIELEEKNQTEMAKVVNVTSFFKSLDQMYHLNVTDPNTQIALLNDFREFLTKSSAARLEVERQDYYVLFRKWFYFSSIASTTIGYGDVAPSTQEGRVFFIAYMLLAVPAMMTLIARCGKILTSVNCHFFRFVYKLCTRKKELLSEGMLSAILFVVVLLGYMQIGPILNSLDNMEWTYIDSIYYWFVTFTTIGFGDINYVINDTQYFLLLYRLFGLALLAGIIDSLLVWLKKRKKDFEKINASKLRNAAMKMTDKMLTGLDGVPIKFFENRENVKAVDGLSRTEVKNRGDVKTKMSHQMEKSDHQTLSDGESIYDGDNNTTGWLVVINQNEYQTEKERESKNLRSLHGYNHHLHNEFL